MSIEIITKESCAKCKFFVSENNPSLGRCYRYPRNRTVLLMPGQIAGSVQAEENTNYPLQAANDWCGEFQKAIVLPSEGRA